MFPIRENGGMMILQSTKGEIMPRTISKHAQKALDLLEKEHPKYPNRKYKPVEAAKKCGIGLSTLYRNIKLQEEANAEKLNKGE
jgi:hypothetical protein